MAAVLLACASAAYAWGNKDKQSQSGTQTTDQQASASHTYQGTVDSFDQDSGMVTIRGEDGMSKEFSLKDARITTEAGREVKLSDLKQGDRLSITYSGDENNPKVENVMRLEGSGTEGGQ